MIKRTLFLLLALTGALAASAQNVDEILTKYFENTGGVENWKKLTSMKMDGNMAMQGMEFPGTIYSAPPNRQRVEVDVQGQKVVQAFDGQTAWGINPFMGGSEPQKMPAEDTEQMGDQDFESPFLNYKDKGHAVELVGEATVEGTATYEIKLTKKNGSVEYHYFDKENYVPIMVKQTIKAGPMKGQTSQTFLSDYQETGGLFFPFFMEVKLNGQTFQKITIKSIQLNPAVTDAMFAFPKK